MKRRLTLVMCFAALFSSSVLAQTWIFYVSAERDFRVLLPGPPTRVTTSSGSVEYRTDTGSHRYSIFRHDPRRIANAAAARDDIILRITSDEQRASNIGQDDGDLAPNEFMFRVGRLRTIHRVIYESGRYYELVVQAEPDDGISRQVARDFFNSFQMGSVRGFPAFSNLPTPDTCQARSNAYSRRFCEYLTCQAAGTESHFACAGVPRLFRN